MKLFVILIVVVLIYIVYNRYIVDCDKPIVKTIKSKNHGPTVLIVCSQHGNEPAPSVAGKQILSVIKNKIKKGTVILITEANPCGLRFNTRSLPNGVDINRSYGEKFTNTSKLITDYANKSDIVLDLHEGWGYNNLDAGSMGSNIYYKPRTNLDAEQICNNSVSTINSSITESYKKFKCMRDDPTETPTTLSAYCERNSIPVLIVETSGQDDIQPIQLRADQHKVVIMETLNRFGIV